MRWIPELFLRVLRIGEGKRQNCIHLRSVMLYLIAFLLLLAVWLLLDEFLLRDRKSEGLHSFTEKVKDVGTRAHWAVGVLAVLIILIVVLRFLFRALAFP